MLEITEINKKLSGFLYRKQFEEAVSFMDAQIQSLNSVASSLTTILAEITKESETLLKIGGELARCVDMNDASEGKMEDYLSRKAILESRMEKYYSDKKIFISIHDQFENAAIKLGCAIASLGRSEPLKTSKLAFTVLKSLKPKNKSHSEKFEQTLNTQNSVNYYRAQTEMTLAAIRYSKETSLSIIEQRSFIATAIACSLSLTNKACNKIKRHAKWCDYLNSILSYAGLADAFSMEDMSLLLEDHATETTTSKSILNMCSKLYFAIAKPLRAYINPLANEKTPEIETTTIRHVQTTIIEIIEATTEEIIEEKAKALINALKNYIAPKMDPNLTLFSDFKVDFKHNFSSFYFLTLDLPLYMANELWKANPANASSLRNVGTTKNPTKAISPPIAATTNQSNNVSNIGLRS